MSYAAEDFSCEVCQCNIFKGDETYTVYANERWYDLCVLCSKGAEMNGWRLI
jgi:hypothetical protein